MQSMTGYGRGFAAADGRELTVELKSVNHRFLDVVYRTPRELPIIEDKLRALVADANLRRGRLEVFATYKNTREDACEIQLDKAILRAFNQALLDAEDELEPFKRATAAEVIELCGALRVVSSPDDEEAISLLTEQAFSQALAEINTMRSREGEHLARDLAGNLAAVEALRVKIADRAPLLPEEYRKRLMARLDNWLSEPIEPQRVAQEVAFMADKAAIDEELSRLSSHVAQFERILNQEPEAGRKLDFLIQEMNREFNTIGSKASDADIAQLVVDAKSVMEKLREQVQNAI